MPQAEEILAGRWALVEKIDEGAMGEIFRGAHAVLGHPVAVKVLIPTVARDKASVDRFLREARIAARLQHRNVVRVEDFGVAEDGRPFLVMELLRGESLAKRLARSPRPTHAEAVDVVRQIALALDVAHSAGIIHRDLKPENVFLAQGDGAAPVVKVLDFGVAKFTDTLSNGAHATASNTLVGTPRYMSPEQARSSRELDGRSDLWALGMIAYEMLTGSHPFEGEAIAELLVAILTHRIAPPTAVRPELPPSLDAWAERALARSRYERYPTGRELADALAAALSDRPDERPAGARTSAPPREEPRRGTLRVRRPSPAPLMPEGVLAASATQRDRPAPEAPPVGPSKATPVLLATAVVVPAPADATPPRGTPARPAPRARPLRAWWAAALAAMLASVTLIVAARRPAPPAAARPAVEGALIASPRAPEEPAPEAPPPPAPIDSAVPAPTAPAVTPQPAPPTAASPASTPAPAAAPSRHHGRGTSRGRHRTTPRAVEGATPAENPRGLYDPTSI